MLKISDEINCCHYRWNPFHILFHLFYSPRCRTAVIRFRCSYYLRALAFFLFGGEKLNLSSNSFVWRKFNYRHCFFLSLVSNLVLSSTSSSSFSEVFVFSNVLLQDVGRQRDLPASKLLLWCETLFYDLQNKLGFVSMNWVDRKKNSRQFIAFWSITRKALKAIGWMF